MRLWHPEILKVLPRNLLLGLHRDCCSLRGKGWSKAQKTVQFVRKYPFSTLFIYHQKILNEMESRGFQPNPLWREIAYRGKGTFRFTEGFFHEHGEFEVFREHSREFLHADREKVHDRINAADRTGKPFEDADKARFFGWFVENICPF